MCAAGFFLHSSFHFLLTHGSEKRKSPFCRPQEKSNFDSYDSDKVGMKIKIKQLEILSEMSYIKRTVTGNSLQFQA